MSLVQLAWLSLWSRRSSTLLTLFSICLSVALLVSVERLRRGAEDGFTGAISQTDLIVGSRTGPVNLLLYTVFNMGSATANISMETFDRYKSHPQVDWVIPISLGDGHRGYRVVATNEDFLLHYHYRGDKQLEFADGRWSKDIWDVVVGAEVAHKLHYKLGDKVVLAHGVTRGDGILNHDDKPFHIVGILKPTGTALDQSLYITLEGMEGIHVDWKEGALPRRDEMIAPENIKAADLKITNITAFFLRTKSRIETLRLQREINVDTTEPLLAIIPGVALSELWRSLGYVATALGAIAWLVVLVGMTSLLISLLTSLQARRREMAILRALGAKPRQVLGLLLFESILLSFLGVVGGYTLQLVVFGLIANYVMTEFGVVLSDSLLGRNELLLLLIALVMGTVAGLVPAYTAVRYSLKDGLNPKA